MTVAMQVAAVLVGREEGGSRGGDVLVGERICRVGSG
jgi:hypothetical protein